MANLPNGFTGITESGLGLDGVTPGTGIDLLLATNGYERGRVTAAGLATGVFATRSVYVPPSGDASGATDPVNIQAAINLLRGVGGVVGLAGNYTLSSGLTLYPAIGLEGLGPINQGSQGTNCLTATSSLNAPVITITLDPSNTSWVSFPWLSNFSISGTHGQTSQDGVLISDANGTVFDTFIDKVLVFDAGGNSFNISNNGKTWITQCYAERAQQNGIRASKGTLLVRDCYIQNNALCGVDATSSGLLKLLGNFVWQNAQFGLLAWSMTTGCEVVGNTFSDNGDNTHAAVRVRSIGPTVLGKPRLVANSFTDARASGSAAQYYIETVPDSQGVQLLVLGNSFDGKQKSGNPAIKVNAHASNNILIAGNPGFNDSAGLITNPLDVTNNKIGLAGTTATAVASTDYVVSECSQYIVASGGTGVSITIKDPAGNTVQSGLSSFAGIVPRGYKVNFGAFTGAPTISSFVA